MRESAEREPDEELLQQLDEGTARLLFPEKLAPDTIRVTLACPPLEDDVARAAEEYLAAASEVESIEDPEAPDGSERLHATFELPRVEELHGLFSLLEEHFDRADLDILVDGRRLPLVRELWLPLLWVLRD